MNPYIKLLSRKRSWTPVQTSKGKLKEGKLEKKRWHYVIKQRLTEKVKKDFKEEIETKILFLLIN